MLFRRMAISQLVLMLVLCFLIARLAIICTNSEFSQAAANQSYYTVDVADTRGIIYDRNFVPLVCRTGEYVAAVMPNNRSADVLLKSVSDEERPQLFSRLEQLTPFTCVVKTDELYAPGLEIFYVPKRYENKQPALHIIGQCDSVTGAGASGIEKAYERQLTATGGMLKVRYETNALKQAVLAAPEIIDTGYLTGAGIVLTIDNAIQLVTEEAAGQLEKGAVVVMDCETGDILASVSRPDYNPNDMASALEDKNAPFINRAFYSYAVGSTFKLLTAATALEQGISLQRSYACKGYIEVGDQIFRCHNLAGHGNLDMTEALEKSCNPYFISLALEVNGPSLLKKAELLGFGISAELAPNMKTQAGTLPEASQLIAPAVTANFGFGQGVLTATPIQIAALVSSIANGGKTVTPRLVEGATSDGKSFSGHTARFEPAQVFLPQAAREVRQMMISVVENGSGKSAKPQEGGAGGKTASAQSGQFVDGEEIVHGWFSGFYPAINPKYTIIVLAEAGSSGGDAAGPIFRQIADGIHRLEVNASNS